MISRVAYEKGIVILSLNLDLIFLTFSCTSRLCKVAPNRKYLHKISILPVVILSGEGKYFHLILGTYRLQRHKKLRINAKLEV